ncbi:MAG: hypothetical protein AVDCRST_MAG93-1580, partial [uncultured Chloroflexia bacterium]
EPDGRRNGQSGTHPRRHGELGGSGIHRTLVSERNAGDGSA